MEYELTYPDMTIINDNPILTDNSSYNNNNLAIGLGIGAGIVIIVLIVVIILVIIFVPQSGGKEGVICQKQEQCARGFICSAGKCAPGLGEFCNSTCAIGYTCEPNPNGGKNICNVAPGPTTSFPIGNTSVNAVTKASAAGVNQQVIAERYKNIPGNNKLIKNNINLPKGLPPKNSNSSYLMRNVKTENYNQQRYNNSYTAPKSATYAEPMFKHLTKHLDLKSISTEPSFSNSEHADRSLSIYSDESFENYSTRTPSPYTESVSKDVNSPIHYNGKSINFKDSNFDAQQIDIIYYNDKYIILLRNGNLILENKSSKQTKNVISTIAMSRIIVFNGYIYGLSDGILYRLDMSTYSSPVWDWAILNDMVQKVTHVSVPLNMEHLWVQTIDNKGYIFDGKFEIINEFVVENGTYRIYGMGLKNWVLVNTNDNTATLYPSNYVIHKVYDAALSHDNQVVVSEDPNRLVRITNWKVAYPYRPDNLPNIAF